MINDYGHENDDYYHDEPEMAQNDSNVPRRKNRIGSGRPSWWIIGGVVVCLVIAGGVGAVLGTVVFTGGSSSDSSPSPATTGNATNTSVSEAPSSSPTMPGDSPMGNNSGSGRMDWVQRGSSLKGSQLSDMFGRSVCISSDALIVAIGASGRNKNGYVRVFFYDGDDWIQMGSDIPGQGNTDFGWSCSMSSDGLYLAVGDWLNNGATGAESGHARVFSFNGTDWSQMGADIEGAAAFDHAGWDVALSKDGGILAVGVPGNDAGGGQAGHIRVYRWNGNAWQQLGQDLVGEAPVDESGKSVSLSNNGTILAIGARRNDAGNQRNDTGHVRVWRINSSNNRWVRMGGDIDGEGAGDESGWASALNGDGTIVAVGAYLNNGNGNAAGHVRVYRFDNGAWVQMGQDLDGASPNAQLGYAVALSTDGMTVAIGAHFQNTPAGSRAGAASVYRFEGNSWVQVGSDIQGRVGGDIFGGSVALSSDGEWIIVGASNEANGGTGYATVYQYGIAPPTTVPPQPVGGTPQPVGSPAPTPMPTPRVYTWTRRGSVLEGDNEEDFFGQSVCISQDGSNVAVGANGRTNGGYVRAYEFDGSEWNTKGSLLALPSTVDLGWSCALSNDGQRIAIGDWLNNGRSQSEIGSVWTFDFVGGDWTQYSSVREGAAAFDHAGWAVALSGDGEILAVSIPGSDGGDGNRNSGLVQIFERVSGEWELLGSPIRGEASGDESGKSVSLSTNGRTVAIGARLNDGRGINTGHVRVYSYDGSAWTQVGQDIDGERQANEFGWSSSISGDGRRLVVGGYLNEGNGFRAGHARIYEFDGTNWNQMGGDIDGLAPNSDFGYSVSMSEDGSTVAIGGPRNSNDSGTRAGNVRTFRYNGAIWEQVGPRLLGVAEDDLFGHKVALSSNGNVLIVGATTDARDGAGYAVVYELQ